MRSVPSAGSPSTKAAALLGSLFISVKQAPRLTPMSYSEENIGELEKSIPYFGGLKQMALDRKRVYSMLERTDATLAFTVRHFDVKDCNPFVVVRSLRGKKKPALFLDTEAAERWLNTLSIEVYAPETNEGHRCRDFLAELCLQLVYHHRYLSAKCSNASATSASPETHASPVYLLTLGAGFPLALAEGSTVSAKTCWKVLQTHVNALCEPREQIFPRLEPLSIYDSEAKQTVVRNIALAKLADSGYFDLRLSSMHWAEVVKYLGFNQTLAPECMNGVYICDGALYEGDHQVRLLDNSWSSNGLHPFVNRVIFDKVKLAQFQFEPVAARDIGRSGRGAGTAYTMVRRQSAPCGRVPNNFILYVCANWFKMCLDTAAEYEHWSDSTTADQNAIESVLWSS